MSLQDLYLANNPLCFWIAYNYWAINTDFVVEPTIGSITPSPSSPSEVAFNTIILDENGNPVTAASPFMIGLVYGGLFGGFVLVSGLIALLFQKKLHRVILAASIILRTPAAVLRLCILLKDLSKTLPFFEGLLASGCWVV